MTSVARVVAKIVQVEIRDALLSLTRRFEGLSGKGLLDKSEASSGLSPESARRTVPYKRNASLV